MRYIKDVKEVQGIRKTDPVVKKEKRKPGNFLLRFCVFVFFLIALEKAWAGLWLYQSQEAFQAGDYYQAKLLSERALLWDEDNPAVLLQAAKSNWYDGTKQKDSAALREGERLFLRLIQELPFYGKGWLYAGLSKLAYTSLEGEKLTEPQWREVQHLLEEGYRREPGNSWMAYVAGLHFLAYSDFLNGESQKKALSMLETSVGILPSRYLEPALNYLWEHFSDFGLLERMTPREYDSYRRLAEFLRKKNLWSYAEDVYETYFDLQSDSYTALCRKGDDYLTKGNAHDALKAYEEAFWTIQTRVWAKAGVLASEIQLKSWPKEYERTLTEILEDEEEPVGHLLGYLESAVDKVHDPYLKGLFQFRRGEYQQAAESLGGIRGGKFRDRYLAQSLSEIGAKQVAIRVLVPYLEYEEVDLRDLLVLKKIDEQHQEEIAKKIKQVYTPFRRAQSWWGKGFQEGRLDHRGKVGMVVNLMPGRSRIEFNVRGEPAPDGLSGFLIFRLQNRVIGFLYADDYEMKTFGVEISTSGGRRWLEAELYNGADENSSVKKPVVELGDLRIVSLEGNEG